MNEKIIQNKFKENMSAARSEYANGMYDAAFQRLEHAHILGQRYFFMHLLSHWWMLKVGIKKSDKREIFGQITRILTAVPGYLFGWIPKGNTGGANISPVKPMPLPTDLEELVGAFNIWHDVRLRLIIFSVFAITMLGLKTYL
ncbi:MAG TPA: DUF3703 domain-containing protein [Hellea balneolensis]|uniref:DUF3703 domain-containing protein n=1 Tax=Hellea balneolensis TaxID=287478 RepID=A0A7C3G0N2_9PROT|nr:DUF3703 domain-containing protein [Hellea balneolensis]